MKTFGNYLLDYVKAIAFVFFMIWLCSSCNDRPAQIKMIHDYGDSIGITKLQLDYIDQQRDSLARTYQQRYPAKAFAPGDTGARYAYAREERAGYHQLLNDQTVFDRHFDPIKYQYLEDLNRYKRIVDSLKLLLQ